jgi:hypothetical protein
MADKRIQRIIQLIFDERAAAKAERQAQASLKRATGGGSASFIRGIGRGLSDIARLGIQAAASITGYAVALSRMVERGGEVINVQRAFTSLFGNQPAAIDKLRKATMGLVSDYDLMKEANMALSLGAARNIDDFGKIAAASIKLGRALGVDANKAMHDLSIGIARGSKRILDNLGIIVDGAITVEKVMEAVDVRVESLGGAAETGADALLRLKISFINLKDAVAVFLANNRQLQIWFRELGGMTDALALTLKHAETGELKEAFKHFGTIMGTIFIQAFLIAVKKAIEHAGPLGGFLLGGGLGALGGGLAGPGGAVVGSAIGGMAGAGLFHGLPKDFQGLIDDHSTVINAEIAALGAMRKEMEERRKKFARMGIHGDRPAALPPPDLEALEEARQAEDQRLQTLLQLHKLRGLESEEWQELLDIHLRANTALEKGNLLAEDRLRMLERRESTAEALGLSPMGAQIVGEDKPEKKLFGRIGGVAAPIGGKTLEEIQLEQLLAGLTFFQRELVTGFDTIVSAAEYAGTAMMQAFQDAFSVLINEGGNVMEFMKELFLGIASAAIGAIAEYAAVKVKEQMAIAAEALVLGLLGDPTKFAAIGAALKAAAAWAAVGGVASSAAAGLSSGGGRGSQRDRMISGRRIDDAATRNTNVYVKVDGIDPDSPKHIALGQRLRKNGERDWREQTPTNRRYSTAYSSTQRMAS